MLFSFVALAIALLAFFISGKSSDEIISLLMKLIGLFGLFLSLVYSLWLIKLLIVIALFVPAIHPE